MPFTKWCGAHYDAHTYGDLGGLVRVDHCCRQHDLHCPYFIKFMEEKYGLWNTNLGTINHCGCDLRSVKFPQASHARPATCCRAGEGGRGGVGYECPAGEAEAMCYAGDGLQ